MTSCKPSVGGRHDRRIDQDDQGRIPGARRKPFASMVRLFPNIAHSMAMGTGSCSRRLQ
jgi:hypothetical protein